MPTVVDTLHSQNGYATDEKLIDMHPLLIKKYAEENPLINLLSKTRDMDAHNVKVQWLEGEELPREVTFTGVTESSASTTITIANYSYLRRDDTLFNPRTEEYVRVETTPTSSSVTVDRGVGGTPETAMQTGDILIFCAPSTEEIGDYATPRSIVNSSVYNYTQEVNFFCETSKSTNAESTWHGPVRQSRQKSMWRDARLRMEMNLLLSQRDNATDTQTGNYFRTMGGLHYYLKAGTNVFNVNGLFTETAFNNWLETIWTNRPSTDKLWFFCAPHVAGLMSDWGRDKIRISPDTHELGLRIDEYQGDLTINIVRHPMLKGPYLRGMGFAVNMDKLAIKWLRKPVMKYNVHTETANFIRDKIEAELSMIVGDEAAHGYIKGVTG